jgi:hypothetical protein
MPPLKSLLHLAFCAVLSLFASLVAGTVLASVSEMFIDYGRGVAPRVVDSSNLRQIGQSAIIFACDNRDQLPNATDLPDYARQLAIGGGLNDASVWVRTGSKSSREATTVLQASDLPTSKRLLNPEFTKLPHLFAVPLNGITISMPPTTPIAWTRGLDLETGKWQSNSPYNGEGGHIVFLSGNVSFYRDLSANGGELRRFSDSKPTASIREALPPDVRISDPTWGSNSNRFLARIPELVRTSIMLLWPAWMLALFPTLTLLLHRSATPTPFKVPRSLKIALFATPVLLLTLSIIFRV